jgi:RNA polymerase sigma-70 factor (ECF subfamily)
VQTDSELVKAALDGQKEAFAELVRRYEQPVRAVAINVLGDNHTAQDAVQDAFVGAYLNLPDLRKYDSFGPWLMKIAHRSALGWASRKPKEISLSTGAAEAMADFGQTLDEGNRELLGAVLTLPDAEKQVVMLRYFAGHSVSQVAESVGRSIGTVTKQLSRAHKRLKEILKESEL